MARCLVTGRNDRTEVRIRESRTRCDPSTTDAAPGRLGSGGPTVTTGPEASQLGCRALEVHRRLEDTDETEHGDSWDPPCAVEAELHDG